MLVCKDVASSLRQSGQRFRDFQLCDTLPPPSSQIISNLSLAQVSAASPNATANKKYIVFVNVIHIGKMVLCTVHSTQVRVIGSGDNVKQTSECCLYLLREWIKLFQCKTLTQLSISLLHMTQTTKKSHFKCIASFSSKFINNFLTLIIIFITLDSIHCISWD